MQRWEYLVAEYFPTDEKWIIGCNRKELDALTHMFRKLLTDQRLNFKIENTSNLFFTISNVNITVHIAADFLGERGWELVSVVNTPTFIDYTFKRPIPSP